MLKTIILIIGVLAVVESLVILYFPKYFRKILLSFFRKKEVIKKAAFIELIIGLILIVFSLLL